MLIVWLARDRIASTCADSHRKGTAVTEAPHTSPKLASQVARKIESDIISAGWPVGAVLGSELDLQQRYGVSRAALREAVRIVEHHRVAVMRRGPSGGLVVRAPDATPSAQALVIYLAHVRTTIPDLMYARLLMEPMAAAMAAQSLTEDGVRRLRTVLGHERKQPGVEIQDGLHVVLGELSGNPVLALFIEVLTLLTRHYAAQRHHTDAQSLHAKTQSHRAHRNIAEATIAGDFAQAQHRVDKHIRGLGSWFAESSPRPGGGAEPMSADLDGDQRKLAEVVADRLRIDINRERLPGGALVGSESELLLRYGTSRAVFREAVRLLEYHSVVIMRRGPGGGLFVSVPDPTASVDAIALYLEYRGIGFDALRTVREAVELGCIERVVAQRDENALRTRLRSALRVGVDTPADELADLSHVFHTELAELTGNPVLAVFQQILTALSARHMNSTPTAASTPSRAEMAAEVARVHGNIAEAILLGDTGLAKHRMRRHLQTLTTEWWH
jgi:DNA-binding FadR family transcriptional regulator